MDHVPTVVPILSAGQHRTPQHGGCFMEIASLLAGERWSDHPRGTHPALAALARAVNDRTSDAGRPALAPLIPSVIGTTTADPRLAPLLVARATRAALDAGAAHQREELVRTLRTAEQMVAAERHRRRATRSYLRAAAPRAINRAVSCLAAASGRAADDALRALLVAAIGDARVMSGLEPDHVGGPADRSSWALACQLVGSVPASARR